MTYIPILILMCAAIGVGGLILVLSHFLGPKLPNRRKDTPFECGVPPMGDARRRFSVRFYLVAILFLLFDVEAIFFFPWAIVYKDYLGLSVNANFILLEMAVFVAILLVGYIYVLRKGALEWD
jgi:NADH-quinone oxidoreductase subunit A